jgi:hypothetical protein
MALLPMPKAAGKLPVSHNEPSFFTAEVTYHPPAMPRMPVIPAGWTKVELSELLPVPSVSLAFHPAVHRVPSLFSTRL